MVKKKSGAQGSDSGKSVSRKSKSGTPDDSQSHVAVLDLSLLIVIESISDLTEHHVDILNELKYPVEVQFRVEHGDEIIGVSPLYSVPDKEEMPIDYKMLYTLPPEPNKRLIEYPLSVKVMGMKGRERGKTLSLREEKSKSSIKTDSTLVGFGSVLAIDFIDLVPLLFGEMEIEAKVASMINVLVRLEGGKLKKTANLLYITLQSIKNPPLEFLVTDLRAISADLDLLYTEHADKGNKTDSKEQEPSDEEWPRLYFGAGRLTSTHVTADKPARRYFDFDKSPPIISQYRNPSDEIKSRDPYGISEGEASIIYFSWNEIKRCILNSEQQDKLMYHLVTNGECMMEFQLKKSEERSRSKKTALELQFSSKYFAKLDLSQLLHPGVNCTQVVSQLEIEMVPIHPVTPEHEEGLNSISKLSNESNISEEQRSEIKYSMSSLLPNEGKVKDAQGRSTYVTVTVELYTSLRQRKTQEELLQSLSEFVNADLDKRPYIYKSIKSPLEARADYRIALLSNVHYLHDLYQEFLQSKGCQENRASNQSVDLVENATFKRVLEENGTLDLLRRRLSNALTSFLRDTPCKTEFDLSECYYKLAEETQLVLDEASRTAKSNPNILATCEELLDAAFEASEDGDYELAQQYLFKRLHYYGDKDPDKWLDLAVLCLKHSDVSKAEHALKTALRINPRHRSSLVMLSTLLATEERNAEAVTIFWCLITFHPRFYYGWFAFYCFFTSVENFQSAEYCLSLGVLSINDKNKDDIEVKEYWVHDTLLIREEDGFMKTAIYLMSLNLWQFAEMCLSFHRSEEKEETMTFLYYLAVCHCLQGKFARSNSHLKEVIALQWNDEKCWNMMGHNLYSCKNWERAEDCYLLILDNVDLLPSCHLTFYRMAQMKFHNKLYEQAYKYFLKAVSLKSTPKAWLGLAKASYWMGQLDDAELAAREANRLNENLSEAWAMYALVHIKKSSFKLARRCLSMSTKCGNICDDIKREIFKELHIQHEDTDDFALMVDNWIQEMNLFEQL